eukprot:6994806-Prorocentrum_lima.AAC.1
MVGNWAEDTALMVMPGGISLKLADMFTGKLPVLPALEGKEDEEEDVALVPCSSPGTPACASNPSSCETASNGSA